MAFITGACRLPNSDHCVHKAERSDAWCLQSSPARPYCSPCAEDDHGCVAAAPDPDVCPAYAPDTAGDTGDTSTGP